MTSEQIIPIHVSILKPVYDRRSPTVGSRSKEDEAIIRCIGVTKVFRDFWLRQRVRAVDGSGSAGESR